MMSVDEDMNRQPPPPAFTRGSIFRRPSSRQSNKAPSPAPALSPSSSLLSIASSSASVSFFSSLRRSFREKRASFSSRSKSSRQGPVEVLATPRHRRKYDYQTSDVPDEQWCWRPASQLSQLTVTSSTKQQPPQKHLPSQPRSPQPLDMQPFLFGSGADHEASQYPQRRSAARRSCRQPGVTVGAGGPQMDVSRTFARSGSRASTKIVKWPPDKDELARIYGLNLRQPSSTGNEPQQQQPSRPPSAAEAQEDIYAHVRRLLSPTSPASTMMTSSHVTARQPGGGASYSCGNTPAMARRRLLPQLQKSGSTRGSNQSLMSLMSSITAAGAHAFGGGSPRVTRRAHASTSSIGGSSTRSSYCDYRNGNVMLNVNGSQAGGSSRGSYVYQSQRASHSRQHSTADTCISALTTRTQRLAIDGLQLKPLFPAIDVASPSEMDSCFVGREWLFRELNDCLLRAEDTTVRCAIIHGQSGTGKTAIARQLAAHSPAFQPPQPDARGSADSGYVNGSRHSLEVGGGPTAVGTAPSGTPVTAQQSPPQAWLHAAAARCVAAHFCSYENAASCAVPEFVCNLAAQLAASPLLRPYADALVHSPKAQSSLTLAQCRRQCASRIFQQHVVGLLKQLKPPVDGAVYILVDGLDLAEYHRPETADSLAAFIRRHAADVPGWLRWVVTVRTEQLQLVEPMPATRRIALDDALLDERIFRDTQEYIELRLSQSAPTQQQLACVSGLHDTDDPFVHFAQHLTGVCRGNLLQLQLCLNLVHSQQLKLRTATYSALPLTLSEVFLLMFNLKFSSAAAFERVSPVLSVILASLHPLTAPQIEAVLAAGRVQNQPPGAADFKHSLETLSDFLVVRADQTLAPFHPAFRDWLMRRAEPNTPKFMLDIRQGHVLLALHLSRRGQLDSDELFELGHHILKAHPYKHMRDDDPEQPSLSAAAGTMNTPQGASGRDCQLLWIQQAAKDLQSALCSMSNLASPNTKVTRLLIAAGASVNAVLPDGQPILCRAAAAGQTDLCALLMECGARVDERDASNFGATAIQLAAANAHLDTIQILHQHKADLLAVDDHERCALVHAAESGDVSTVSFLLQCDWTTNTSSQQAQSSSSSSGAESCQRQRALQQAFVAAASHNHIRVCQFLVDMCDVPVDSVCPVTQATALNQAAQRTHVELIKYLLSAGACPRAVKGASSPPLLSAVTGGSWEVVSLLLARGLDVEQEADSRGFTPLMAAAQSGHIGVMELLLSRGASVDRVDCSQRSALHHACAHNQYACVSLLLDRGCSLSAPDAVGATALHAAAANAGKRVVTLLLERGCGLETVDEEQQRPIDVAVARRNLASLNCFLRRGAKLSSLTWSLARQHPDVAIVLLQKLVDDGTLLYRRNRLSDATHRFEYAQRKLAWLCLGESELLAQAQYAILVGLGRCRRRQGHHADAIDCCNEATQMKHQLASGGFEAYLLRAKCHFDSQDTSSALRDAQTACRLCPQSTEASQLLATLSHSQQQQQPLRLDTTTSATSVVGPATNKRCSPADCSSDSGNMADFEDPNTLSPTHHLMMTNGDTML